MRLFCINQSDVMTAPQRSHTVLGVKTGCFSYQVVLLVVHLGRVSPHAVHSQEKVHEGE